MTFNFLGIGNPVYDVIITPKIRREERVLSGCSTNSCLACRKLGLDEVALIGSIGLDFKERLVKDLKKYGIKVPSIITSDETGGFKLVYQSNGDRTLEVLGVAGKIGIDNVPKESLKAKAVVLGPILQEIDLQFIKDFRAKSDALVLLDPQGLIRTIDGNRKIVHEVDLSVVKEAIRFVDFVKPNEMEAQVITGYSDPYKAAKRLVEWGARVGLVTLAERGSVVYDGNHYYRIPAYKTELIDATGSGDTYAGSFFFEYLRTFDLWRSSLFASAAASMKVENSGPDFPLLEDEVRRRVSVIERMASRS